MSRKKRSTLQSSQTAEAKPVVRISYFSLLLSSLLVTLRFIFISPFVLIANIILAPFRYVASLFSRSPAPSADEESVEEEVQEEFTPVEEEVVEETEQETSLEVADLEGSYAEDDSADSGIDVSSLSTDVTANAAAILDLAKRMKKLEKENLRLRRRVREINTSVLGSPIAFSGSASYNASMSIPPPHINTSSAAAPAPPVMARAPPPPPPPPAKPLVVFKPLVITKRDGSTVAPKASGKPTINLNEILSKRSQLKAATRDEYLPVPSSSSSSAPLVTLETLNSIQLRRPLSRSVTQPVVTKSDLSCLALKRVAIQRSPGGTPVRRDALLDVANTTHNVMSAALRRKFENVRSPKDKAASPKSPISPSSPQRSEWVDENMDYMNNSRYLTPKRPSPRHPSRSPIMMR